MEMRKGLMFAMNASLKYFLKEHLLHPLGIIVPDHPGWWWMPLPILSPFPEVTSFYFPGCVLLKMNLSAGRPLCSGRASVLPVYESQVWQMCVYVWLEPESQRIHWEAAEGLWCQWQPTQHLQNGSRDQSAVWTCLYLNLSRIRAISSIGFPPSHSGLIVPTSKWQDKVP